MSAISALFHKKFVRRSMTPVRVGAASLAREGVWLALSWIGAAYYFVHFFVVLPVVGVVERPRPLPFSISQAVLPATAKAP